MHSLMKLFIIASIVLAFLYSCYDYNNPLDPDRDDKRPANPVNLRVSKISHNKVGLVFEVIGSDILGIIIRRDGVKIDSITEFDSTYLDTNNIKPSTSYSYSVSSFNKHGSSEASNTIKILTPSENINVFGGLTLNARLEKIEFRKDILVTVTPKDTALSPVSYPMDTLGHLEIPMIMKPGEYYLTLYRYGFSVIKDTVAINSFKITTLDTFILKDNLPPEVDVNTDDYYIKHLQINDTVHLSVTSSDSLYSVTDFEWRFEGRNEEFFFNMTGSGDTSLVMRYPGLFTAYLTATDENGNSTTDSLYVNVDLFYEVDTASFYSRQNHAAVVFDNKMWIIGGVSYDTTLSSRFLNDVWCSSDGKEWVQATDSAAFGGREGHEVVVFNNKMYMIGGYPGGYYNAEIWSSTDGVNWELEIDSAECGGRQHHTCTVWDGAIWLVGGKHEDGNESRNDIWTSTDGVNWTELNDSADFPPVYGHSTQVFKNQIWIMGGFHGNYRTDEVWYSSDGLSWSVVPRKDTYNHFNNRQFSGRNNLMSLVYNDQLCVIGGIGCLIIGGPGSTIKKKPMDDLWVTDDGHNWSMICGSEWINVIREYHDNDEFVGIASSEALVFNGKIWLVGGANFWEQGTSVIYCMENYQW